MSNRGALDLHEHARLSDTHKPLHSVNNVHDLLRGTTYWINERMHGMTVRKKISQAESLNYIMILLGEVRQAVDRAM